MGSGVRQLLVNIYRRLGDASFGQPPSASNLHDFGQGLGRPALQERVYTC